MFSGKDRVIRFFEKSGDLDLLCFVDPFAVGQVFLNIFENSLAACRDPVEIEVHYSDGRKAASAAGDPRVRPRQRCRSVPEQRNKSSRNSTRRRPTARDSVSRSANVSSRLMAGRFSPASSSPPRKWSSFSPGNNPHDPDAPHRRGRRRTRNGQKYLQETLTLLGHQVVGSAATGRQLLETCAETKPDMVLTDIKMPDMDGIEAVRRLCQTHSVPVVLVSAYHDAELIERAMADHVMAYLVNPIKQADLETTIALSVRRFKEFTA